jgi:hypothetical protein
VVNVEKLLLFLVQGIPESSGVIALSLALARVPLRWGRIITAGTVMAVIAFFIRTSSFAAGLHTVAGLLLTVVIITTATRVSPTKAFVVTSISIIILGFLEMIIFRIYSALKILEPQLTMSSDPPQRLLALPQAAIIIFAALLIPRFMTPEQDVWKI